MVLSCTQATLADLGFQQRQMCHQVELHTCSVQALVGRMHANKQRWVLILDPCIHVSQNYTPYTTGIAQDVFVKDITGKPYLGQARTCLIKLNVAHCLCAVCALLSRSADFVTNLPSAATPAPCGLSCHPLAFCNFASYRDIFARERDSACVPSS